MSLRLRQTSSSLNLLRRALWVVALSLAFSHSSLFAQSARALVVDGNGPWRDAQWGYTAGQFTALLTEAGYSVSTVAPEDIASATASSDLLLAVPSLESLPVEAMSAVIAFSAAGGELMASGGEPFRNPLYRGPDGSWVGASGYQAATGSPPSQTLQYTYVPTYSPSQLQYTTVAGTRVPILTRRGLFGAFAMRTKVIGDVLAPAALVYSDLSPAFSSFPVMRRLAVWLPSPSISEPYRTQLVTALRNAIGGVHLQGAGPTLAMWLPGETIAGQARFINMSKAAVNATLVWSIAGGAASLPQSPMAVTIAGEGTSNLTLKFPALPNGDYTLHFDLKVKDSVVDSIETPLRIFDPAASRQPSQKIKAIDGSFYADGKRVFLHGVNYWPRYAANTNWLTPELYDPVQIEADLSVMESLHFNLVNLRYIGPFLALDQVWAPQARSLIDFLERCRNHHIWARIDLPTMMYNNAYGGTLIPLVGAFLNEAFLPGNDRVFAYDLLWEPFIGMENSGGYSGIIDGRAITQGTGRVALDSEWRAWVNDQYGSLANAIPIWGVAPPLDTNGQLTNPTDQQMTEDGPWRIMVAAYRRFADDYLGRNIGSAVREIRRSDPDTLVTYRNWLAMTAAGNASMGYDLGTGAAHLDFVSPEKYELSMWPETRNWGFTTAYGRYRTGGKPVQWVEFGYDIGAGGLTNRVNQTSFCDGFLRLVSEDGSSADTVWWWPGGIYVLSQQDFGIIDPDGTPRGCAQAMAEWGAKFEKTPPAPGSDFVTLAVDRDADARGQYGLFLKWSDQYVSARESGRGLKLTDDGTGSDTATMPVVQVGNAPYAGAGPLKFANAEFGGMHVTCPGVDTIVENGAQVPVPSGAECQVTATMVNTGEATWLPTASSRGGVFLRTTAGNASLMTSLAALQRTALAPLQIKIDQGDVLLTGRMSIQGVGDFGEVLRVMLVVAQDGAACAASITPGESVSAPAIGSTGTINVTAGANCDWSATSVEPWVSFAPSTGPGSAKLTYSIGQNVGPARLGSVLIAGHSLTVTQAGANPSFASAPSVSPTSLDFGPVSLGTTGAARIVTVKNTSAAPLILNFINIGGTNSGDFAQSNTCGSTLAGGGSCSIAVRFSPAKAGPRAASLFIGSTVIGLSGAGVGTGAVPVVYGIADAWNYTSGSAPGRWGASGGSNLAPCAEVATLGLRDTLPTELGGVRVTINGAPAALSFAGPSQINALVPSSIGPGPTSVVVEVNGVASNAFLATAKTTQPAILAVPNADGSMFSVTAALQGTGFLVGNRGVDPRVNRGAFPGEIVDLYMLGLGATQDPSAFVTDRPFAGAFPIGALLTARVGGLAARVIFAGLTSPGLYLVRIEIPSGLAAGNQPVEVSLGQSPANTTSPFLTLTIQNQ